jgi:hypothetical protein
MGKRGSARQRVFLDGLRRRDGKWQMANGKWQMANGRLKMADGRDLHSGDSLRQCAPANSRRMKAEGGRMNMLRSFSLRDLQ